MGRISSERRKKVEWLWNSEKVSDVYPRNPSTGGSSDHFVRNHKHGAHRGLWFCFWQVKAGSLYSCFSEAARLGSRCVCFSSGGASCAEPGGPSARSIGCRPHTWRAWLPCVFGSVWWARLTERSASRSSPTCNDMVSHLEQNRTRRRVSWIPSLIVQASFLYADLRNPNKSQPDNWAKVLMGNR